jgi:soluble lytic murein transglycosylase
VKRLGLSLFLLFFATLSLAEPKADFGAGHARLVNGSLAEALYYLDSALADQDFILRDYVRYDVGEVYFKNGNYSLAAAEYQKVGAESVLYPLAAFKIASSFNLAENSSAAKAAYRKYFQNFSDEDQAPLAGMKLAGLYEKAGEFEAAYQVYNQIDLYYPLSSYAKEARVRFKKLAKKHHLPQYQSKAKDLYKKGLTYLKQDKYDAAEAVFFRLAREFPKSKYVSETFFLMGRAELWGDKTDSAISNIEKSLSFYNTASRKARNLYYLGRAYGRRGKYENAMVYMKQVLEDYPESAYADDATYYLALYFEYADMRKAAIPTYLYLAEKYPNSMYVDNSLFRAGILSYKFYDFDAAYRIFGSAMRKGQGEETPKCLLWWGKLAERDGKSSEAAGIYYYLVKRFDHSYAAYRAQQKLLKLGYKVELGTLGKSPDPNDPLATITGTEDDDQQELDALMDNFSEKHPQVEQNSSAELERYRMLMDLGITEYALLEAKKVLATVDESSRVASQITMGKILQKAGEYRTPIGLTEAKLQSAILAGKPNVLPSALWELAYPKGYFDEVKKYSDLNGLDPYLTLALIREESRFNPRALSRSKAHGLMQIIPSTGKLLAKQLGMLPFYRKSMFEVDTNVKMGTLYLHGLIERFDGNVFLALAGYNGGPSRVKRWVNDWYKGDMVNLDIDEFIEYIPLRETRNYVQKVMGSYYEYKRLYEGR